MRDYDPTTGRYIQADPLGLVDGASVYGYVRANPGRYIDPRGESHLPNNVQAMCDVQRVLGWPVHPGCNHPRPVPQNMCTAMTPDDCTAAFEAENEVCRMLYDQNSRRQCFQQAQRNYAECLRYAR